MASFFLLRYSLLWPHIFWGGCYRAIAELRLQCSALAIALEKKKMRPSAAGERLPPSFFLTDLLHMVGAGKQSLSLVPEQSLYTKFNISVHLSSMIELPQYSRFDSHFNSFWIDLPPRPASRTFYRTMPTGCLIIRGTLLNPNIFWMPWLSTNFFVLIELT